MPIFNSSGRASGAISFGHGGHGGHSGSRSWNWGSPWLGGYPYGYSTIGIRAYPYTSFPTNPTAQWYLNAMGISCAVWNGIQDIALKKAMVKKLFATYGMTLSDETPTDAVRIQQVIDAASQCAAIQSAAAQPYSSWLGGPGLIRPWGIPLTPFGLGGLGFGPKIIPSGAVASGMVSPLLAWIGGAVLGGAATVAIVKRMKK